MIKFGNSKFDLGAFLNYKEALVAFSTASKLLTQVSAQNNQIKKCMSERMPSIETHGSHLIEPTGNKNFHCNPSYLSNLGNTDLDIPVDVYLATESDIPAACKLSHTELFCLLCDLTDYQNKQVLTDHKAQLELDLSHNNENWGEFYPNKWEFDIVKFWSLLETDESLFRL